KRLAIQVKEFRADNIEVQFCAVGAKAKQFFSSFGGNLVASRTNLGDAPELVSLIGSIKVMLEAYDEGKIDRLYIMHNRFVNTMTQKPVTEQLLPLKAIDDDLTRKHWDYL